MNNIIFIIIWIISGIFAYGLTLAYYQKKYNKIQSINEYKKDVIYALFFGALGIFGLLSTISFLIIMNKNPFKYGLQYKYKEEQ